MLPWGTKELLFTAQLMTGMDLLAIGQGFAE